MRSRVRSLRGRLIAITFVALAAALVGTGLLLSNLFRQHVEAQFEAQLLRQLDQLTAGFELDAAGHPTLRAPLSDPRWEAPYSGLYWQIEPIGAAASGARREEDLLRSRSLWDAALPVPEEGPGKEDLHRHRVPGPRGQTVLALERYVLVLPAGGSETAGAGWRLMVAEDVAGLEAAVDGFSRQLALFLFILGLALLAAAWAQVSLGLAPLQRLQRAVQAVRESRSPRLQGGFPSEMQPLVDDFNRVLDQNQQVVARARQLSGNLAHAIKTPLAVLSNLEAPGGELREQVSRIREQVDWHLRRARFSSAGVPGLRTEVGPVLESLARVLRKVHAHRGSGPAPELRLEPVPAGLFFDGESEDLQEMAGNLLDNACKWARSQVRVHAALHEGRLVLRVEDDGPGVPPAQREAVLGRGVRADERVEGSGLGLAIARELAHLYGGELALGDSALGGLGVELRLPGRSKVS